MSTVWIVISIILGIAVILLGLGCFIVGFFDDDVELRRFGALALAVGVPAAIIWPLLIASVVPALIIYGVLVGFRATKHKSLNY